MDLDFHTFVSTRMMQLKQGPMYDAYRSHLLANRCNFLRIVVSRTNRGFIKGVAERVARKLKGRFCYVRTTKSWDGIVLIPFSSL